MKILTLTTLFPNNQNPNHGIFTYNRVKALAALGHEIEVVAPVPYFPFVKMFARFSRWHKCSQIHKAGNPGELKIYHPRYLAIPKIGYSLYGLLMYYSIFSSVAKIKKSFDFEIIDGHYAYPDGLAVAMLAKKFNCPAVISALGSDVEWDGARNAPIRFWLKKTLEYTAGCIAVSSNLKEDMVALGRKPESIDVISNGVYPEQFPHISKEKARKDLGLPETGKIIISVGRIVFTKNFILLIQAIRNLTQGEKLYIIGEGSMRQSLQEKIDEYDLRERVQLIGALPNNQLWKWYNAADIFAFSSLSEGSPNVVYEALACGTPVVSSPLPGVRHLLEDGQKGILVADWDVKLFTRALHHALWKKQYNRPWIAQQSQQRTWHTVAKEVECVLQKALAQYHG